MPAAPSSAPRSRRARPRLLLGARVGGGRPGVADGGGDRPQERAVLVRAAGELLVDRTRSRRSPRAPTRARDASCGRSARSTRAPRRSQAAGRVLEAGGDVGVERDAAAGRRGPRSSAPASGRGPGDGASGIGPSGAGGGMSGDASARRRPSRRAARCSRRACAPSARRGRASRASGMIPAIGTRPCVGLIELMPQQRRRDAHRSARCRSRSRPGPSAPRARRADPPLDPPAERVERPTGCRPGRSCRRRRTRACGCGRASTMPAAAQPRPDDGSPRSRRCPRAPGSTRSAGGPRRRRGP